MKVNELMKVLKNFNPENDVDLINNNYPDGNTTEILFELVDKCTHSWDDYRNLTIKMLKNLDEETELIGVIEAVRQ